MQKTPTVRIAIHEGDAAVREEVFTQKTIRIGKAGQAHLRLSDTNVSRQHAVIEVLDNGQVRLTDLESTNGTLLNGDKVSQAVLKSGDEIVLGAARLVVTIEGGEQKAESESFYQAGAKDTADVTDRTALEIAVLWNDELVTVNHFQEGSKALAGDKVGAAVFLPEEDLGTPLMELASPDGANFLIDVSGDKVTGDCLVDGKVLKLADLKSGTRLKDGKLVIDTKTKARLKYGPFTLMISLSFLPKAPKMGAGRRLNVGEQAYTLISLIVHLLFLLLVTLIPEEQLKATKDPYVRRSQAFKMVQVAEFEKLQKQELDRKAQEEDRKRRAEEAKKAKIEADKNPQPTMSGVATMGVGHQGPHTGDANALTSKLTPNEAKVRDKKVAASALTNVLGNYDDLMGGVLGSGGTGGAAGGGGGGGWGGGAGGGGGMPGMGGGGIRVIGSTGGTGLALSGGLDAFGGSIGGGGSGGFAGSPAGFGGGGGRGGRGGGGGGGGGWGSEFGPADLKGLVGDELDKAGAEGHGGGPKVKFTSGGLAPVVVTGPVSISGELDKDTVRRYIQTKMDQIRWCYQQEVQKNPDLAGQVVMSWVIDPTGRVIGVKMMSSSMSNASVESCITSRIQTWMFPAPKGGGAVKVNYPFIFRVTK